MVHVAWLHGGMCVWRLLEAITTEAASFIGVVFSWGGCGRLPAFSLFLQTMSTAPDYFLQASDELPNT